MEKVYHFQ